MGSQEQLTDVFGKTRQLRKRRAAADLQGRYQQLRVEHPNASAGALRRTLLGEFGTNEVPSERTIREWLKRDGVPPEAKPWGLGSLDSPERTSSVVAILRRIAPAQWWPNEDEAWWASQLLLGAPATPPEAVPSLARLYWLRAATGAQTIDLDEFVAFAPWDADCAVAYQQAIDTGDINPPPVELQNFVNDEKLDHQTLMMMGGPRPKATRQRVMQSLRELGEMRAKEVDHE